MKPPSAGPAKSALYVLFAFGLSLTISEGFARTETDMPTKPKPSTVVLAREALKKMDWKEAEYLYLKAYEAGTQPEESLLHIVECRCNLKNYDGALAACNDLAVVLGGVDTRPALLRGIVYKEWGKTDLARGWFQRAADDGDRKATRHLEILNGGK